MTDASLGTRVLRFREYNSAHTCCAVGLLSSRKSLLYYFNRHRSQIWPITRKSWSA